MRVPTRLISTEFLAVLRVVHQVNEDIRCILVGSNAFLGRIFFWFKVSTDLLIVLISDFGLSGIVHVSIYISRIEAPIALIVILPMVRIFWPDLLDICLSHFGNLLLSSGWWGQNFVSSLLLAARDKILAIWAHSEGVFLWCWINNIVLHRAG